MLILIPLESPPPSPPRLQCPVARGFFAFSFLALSPRGIEQSADVRSAEGGARSELDPLRAETRSAVARAGANVPPGTLHELPPRVLASLNIYLTSFQ